MTPIPEVCITHGTALILCEHCVAETAMRMRRRLAGRMANIVAQLGQLTTDERFDLLTALEVELERELPG